MSKYTKNPNEPTAEERAIERFSDMMIERIEKIAVDYTQPWFSTHYKTTPLNMSGRRYNGMNYFMLQMVCDDKDYKTPCFATHAQLTSLNFDGKGNRLKDADGNDLPYVSVIKGEKSFPVFITIFNVRDRKTREAIKYEDYKNLDDNEKKDYDVYPNLKVFSVFNIDQTNLSETRPDVYNKLVNKYGKDEIKETGKKFHFKKMDSMLKEQNWFCPIELGDKNNASYSPVLDRVKLPSFKMFKKGESFYSTAFHEMAHSLGHESRLNRAEGMTAKFGSVAYGKEELIAEMTAALVCHTYGFGNAIKDEAASYLKAWCKSIKEDPTYIKSVLLDVKRCYAKITDRIDTIE